MFQTSPARQILLPLTITVTLFVSLQGFAQQQKSLSSLRDTPKSDVFLQAFYWNSTPGGVWWDSLAKLAPRLASAGFSAVWVPPPEKGYAGGFSMGYDPYDHYDFGEYNQYGTVETRFGSRQELINSINTFHSVGMQVFADAVMGHMNGGEQKVPFACEPYPEYPDSGFLIFNYPNGSGRFKKDASFFYPNLQTCDVNPPYHGPSDPIFKFGEVLAHAQSKVKDSLIVWGQYLRNTLGFDGFRIDAVKHIDPIFVGPWLQQANPGGYAIAEYYGSASEIGTWLHYCQNVFGGDVSMLDFPLRFSLQDMCNNTSGGYDMTWLDGAGLINAGISGYDIATFVENHDLDRVGWDGNVDNGHNPIIYNKDMAYAYTIFSEGRPCVWFRDYFMYGLGGKIDTLMWIRQNFVYGGTTKRDGLNPFYVGSIISQADQARDIYVARRNGGDGKPAVYLVINDNPSEWRGVYVDTQYPNQVFRDHTGVAIDKQAAGDGRVDLWAPPRGYAIYVPDTTFQVNHPPFVLTIPDQQAFTNTPFSFQLNYGDPNNDSVTFTLSGNPSWLGISATGLLSGTPGPGDTIQSSVVLTVTDDDAVSVSDTFFVDVFGYPLMDGIFEGTGVWGAPIHVADTLQGWDSTRVRELYVSMDNNFVYFGANVKARDWMNWVFLINTKGGGGQPDSWLRSILYDHANRPDYALRGLFTNYAELHTWSGSAWSGVGVGLPSTESSDNITSTVSTDGWVEARVPRSSIGNPSVLGVQCFITGSLNTHATFDACPNDQNTTTWGGITTRLHYYAMSGPKAITHANIQFPDSIALSNTGSAIVYARAYGTGITDSTGQGAGTQAWIGYNSTNTNPATWTNWIPATYNLEVTGSEEYKATLGTPTITPGSYFYASRFQYSSGPYIYGGYSGSGGGVWDSVTNKSGRLRMYAFPAVPILTSPADDSTDLLLSPVLSWEEVTDAQSYRVQVAADSLFSSVVFDDSAVTTTSRQVGPLPYGSTYYWRVRAKNISGIGAFSTSRTFHTIDASTVNYPFRQAWNLVSLPMEVFDRRKEILFPTASSNAFSYSPETGYSVEDTLLQGVGYWLKFPSAENIGITGVPMPFDSISVETGWNVVGSVSNPIPVASIIQMPDTLVQSAFYSYDGSYQATDTLFPSKAYWVKASTDGILVLSTATFASTANKSIFGTEQLGSVVFEDATGKNSTHIIKRQTALNGKGELPPFQPKENSVSLHSFQQYIETISSGGIREVPVTISDWEFPLSIQWDILSTDCEVTLKIKSGDMLLRGRGTLIIKEKEYLVLILNHLNSINKQSNLDH